MNLGEAKIVAGIVASADGFCCVCVRDLCDQLVKEFPDFPWHKWADVDDEEEP